MDLTPYVPAGRQLIQGYGAGGFRIAGIRHEGPLLVFPSRTIAWPLTAEAITEESLVAVLAADPAVELLLLGTGARMEPPPAGLRQQLRSRGVMLDAMDTGAACRTFNVLMAEERRVAAALIPV